MKPTPKINLLISKKDYQLIQSGYYTASYFLKSQQIAQKFWPDVITKVQFFHTNSPLAKVCGLTEVISIIKNCLLGEIKAVIVHAIPEGSFCKPYLPVLTITGRYWQFAHLENIIDGLLARCTTIATKAWQLSVASKNIPIIFMFDRADDFHLQPQDGYAAALGNLKLQVTGAHLAGWSDNAQLVGTIPHALIQLANGDICQALAAYAKTFPNDKLVGLIDFNNDVLNDGLKLLTTFKEKLYAIRVDTASAIQDKSFWKNNVPQKDQPKYNGCNPTLIKKLRQVLDKNHGQHVKIIVSSGFNVNLIQNFIKSKTPVDFFGVGADFQKDWINFTCDAVLRNNTKLAKFGRKEMINHALELINL